MIPTELEKLILAGKAKFKTYAMGGSGVGTIEMNASSKIIVVIGFDWNPFDDGDVTNQVDPLTASAFMHHTMRLNNGADRFHWNFRDSWAALPVPFNLATRLMPFFGQPHHYPAYVVSKQSIIVDIWKFGDPQNTNWSESTPPTSTGEEDVPQGYGLDRVNRRIVSSNQAIINNMGIKRDPSATAGGGNRVRNEMFDEIHPEFQLFGDQTKVISPGAPDGFKHVFAYPLVNFYYVEVNEVPDGFLQ